jgi:hypothetical protein
MPAAKTFEEATRTRRIRTAFKNCPVSVLNEISIVILEEITDMVLLVVMRLKRRL